MNDPASLEDRLAALREASAGWEPPATVDTAIAAAVARHERAARRARHHAPDRHSILWPLALAAAIGVLSFIVRSLPPADDRSAAQHANEVVPDAARHAFTPVVSADELRDVGEAVVVPARVPRLTLAQFGLPIDPGRVDDAVDAELLVRRDGALLAYRFVN